MKKTLTSLLSVVLVVALSAVLMASTAFANKAENLARLNARLAITDGNNATMEGHYEYFKANFNVDQKLVDLNALADYGSATVEEQLVIAELTNFIPLFKGEDNGAYFGVDEELSRAVVAEILLRLARIGELNNYETELKEDTWIPADLEEGTWYYESVLLAVQNGVFDDQDEFVQPRDPVTYAEMVAMTLRFFEVKESEAIDKEFFNIATGMPREYFDRWYTDTLYAAAHMQWIWEEDAILPVDTPTKITFARLISRAVGISSRFSLFAWNEERFAWSGEEKQQNFEDIVTRFQQEGPSLLAGVVKAPTKATDPAEEQDTTENEDPPNEEEPAATPPQETEQPVTEDPPVTTPSLTAPVTLGCNEIQLTTIDVINDYRETHGLSRIPASPSLCLVAQTHAQDYMLHKESFAPECNAHSWSDQGGWSECCYTSDHAQAACMWNKPEELTNYSGDGFEISLIGRGIANRAEAEYALERWQSSTGHHEVIINGGIWAKRDWKAIGVGTVNGYAAVWFGSEEDSQE